MTIILFKTIYSQSIKLIYKKLMPELKEFVSNLPLKGLDYPNEPFKDDVILLFDK